MRSNRINDTERQPGEEFSEPPEWLSDSSRAQWERRARRVRILGCGAWASDADGVAALVHAADNVTRLAKVITAAPMVVKGTDGSRIANPILRTFENSCTHMLRLAEQ